MEVLSEGRRAKGGRGQGKGELARRLYVTGPAAASLRDRRGPTQKQASDARRAASCPWDRAGRAAGHRSSSWTSSSATWRGGGGRAVAKAGRGGLRETSCWPRGRGSAREDERGRGRGRGRWRSCPKGRSGLRGEAGSRAGRQQAGRGRCRKGRETAAGRGVGLVLERAIGPGRGLRPRRTTLPACIELFAPPAPSPCPPANPAPALPPCRPALTTTYTPPSLASLPSPPSLLALAPLPPCFSSVRTCSGRSPRARGPAADPRALAPNRPSLPPLAPSTFRRQ